MGSNSNSHLTLEDRKIIEQGISKCETKASIAATLGKDKSTIGKEIKLHRVMTYKCHMPLECSNYRHCQHGRNCKGTCPDYSPFCCSRRDRSPGACNGCPNFTHCRFDKYKYIASKAQAEYEETLVDSRKGVNLTEKEAKDMASTIAPLIQKGQSPYTIVTNHPELGICEKTLYNYIEGGIFEFTGSNRIISLDLRRQPSRRISKKASAQYRKRVDRKFLKGREYTDYQAYIAENPNAYVTQMDTVYNDITNGPYIQTFQFVKPGILFCIYHEEKTAKSMCAGIDLLEKILGQDIFRKYVEVLLTDRGSEFSAADAMEADRDGSRRTRVFYCDPMRSGQKGTLENKHIELRYILPKECDLRALGLTDQNALNLAVSHINSKPEESLEGKSALELTRFLYKDLFKRLKAFGIKLIDKDEVTLKPYLLKKQK